MATYTAQLAAQLSHALVRERGTVPMERASRLRAGDAKEQTERDAAARFRETQQRATATAAVALQDTIRTLQEATPEALAALVNVPVLAATASAAPVAPAASETQQPAAAASSRKRKAPGARQGATKPTRRRRKDSSDESDAHSDTDVC